MREDVLPGEVSKSNVCLLASDFLNKYGSFPKDLKIVDAIERNSIGAEFLNRRNPNPNGNDHVFPKCETHQFSSSNNTLPSYPINNYSGYNAPSFLYPNGPFNHHYSPFYMGFSQYNAGTSHGDNGMLSTPLGHHGHHHGHQYDNDNEQNQMGIDQAHSSTASGPSERSKQN